MDLTEINNDDAHEAFVSWLQRELDSAGTGSNESDLDVAPSGRYWLGRLAPEDDVMNSPLGERAERLEPCAIGMRVRPASSGSTTFKVRANFCVWTVSDNRWLKSSTVMAEIQAEVPLTPGDYAFGRDVVGAQVTNEGLNAGYSAEVRVTVEKIDSNFEFTILLINTSTTTENGGPADPRLYEVRLEIIDLKTTPFLLESLPDSFRYDRRQAALGINCGVFADHNGNFFTRDTVGADRYRPRFSPHGIEPEPLSFESLAERPLPILDRLLDSLTKWGDATWSKASLARRAETEQWSEGMKAEAQLGSKDFWDEVERLKEGVGLLKDNALLMRSFQLMNRSFIKSSRGRYATWRPFQIGFVLTTLKSLLDSKKEREIADIVWFATGGGKTETYLGILVTAAFFDRLRGKSSGITAWSRFPLRMLSLQQTQRFANALAAADIVRASEGIAGDCFSLGFFVGSTSTPNTLPREPKPGDWDMNDEEMPKKVRVLEYCPYCGNPELSMGVNRKTLRLEHRCGMEGCPCGKDPLPMYVVDDEIYRFLPTVVVGTLDKAASIGMQASMRGFVGAPWGKCSVAAHGYTYSIRKGKSAHGCLIEGCKGSSQALEMPGELFGPTFRLQDELHLLKDSLGAVDAHYETLLDGLQHQLCGSLPKILGSSATLSGYEKQVDVLYRRQGRVFPQPGPSRTEGFWTCDSKSLMRRYVAVAPRGVTIEYAVDRSLTVLQRAVRRLEEDPVNTCKEIGIAPTWAATLLDHYGTNVVYGNNLKDLDAVVRSAATQIQVEGKVNTKSLTGRSTFEEVRDTLRQLEFPDNSFEERVHLVAASSMMSHGVDIDRLNVMVMLGLPLTTAEFIQASARVGRRYPGLVLVMHKIGRERDASVFRSFDKFIEQGDRFVEAVPVTRRRRRVLERTLPGLVFARILCLHEHTARAGLTTIPTLQKFYRDNPDMLAKDEEALTELLADAGAQGQPLKEAISEWFTRFRRNLEDPPVGSSWPTDLSPTTSPMRSLRDVEDQVKIFGSEVD